MNAQIWYVLLPLGGLAACAQDSPTAGLDTRSVHVGPERSSDSLLDEAEARYEIVRADVARLRHDAREAGRELSEETREILDDLEARSSALGAKLHEWREAGADAADATYAAFSEACDDLGAAVRAFARELSDRG